MPDPELRELVAAAQARSEAFMQSSRQQMFQSFQEQRAVGVGSPGGMRSSIGVGGDRDRPQPGTPSGRLMDAITDIVRRGAAFGGGVAGGVARPVFAGGAAGVGAVAGAGTFLAGESPFGPAGIAGGTITDMQRRMGFFQTAFAGYGEGLPFGLGRYAAQRMDMESYQARAMAQEDLRDRFVGGARRGGFSALNLLSFGLMNYGMRRAGLTLEYGRTEQFSRHIQNQMRFVTRDTLRAAGMSQYAGPFATGITREGAREFGRPLAREMGRLEAEMGLSPEEMMALESRAVGTMGITRLNEVISQGPEAMASSVMRQTRSVRDIQRTLNLSEEEAKEFFSTIGQLYGTADRIAGMAEESRRYAGRWGMNKRQVFDIMREFEDMGRQMGLGQTRTREVGMGYVESMRAQQRMGIMGREELMRYGGRTEEEALRIQARMRFERGVGMFEQGRLGGLGMLMTQDRDTYMQFMTGRMGPMEVAGAIGGVTAADPLAFGTARYDPNTRTMAGRLANLTQYRATMAMKQGGMMIFGGRETEMIQDFQQRTGYDDMTAAQEFRRLQRERAVFTRMAGRAFGGRDSRQRGHDIQSVFHRLTAEGLGEFASGITGKDLYGSAVDVYSMMLDENGNYDTSKSIEDVLRERAVGMNETPGDIAGLMRESRYALYAGATRAEGRGGFDVGPGLERARWARENLTSDVIGKFLSPLAQRLRGSDTERAREINRLMFGGAGTGSGGIRMPIGLRKRFGWFEKRVDAAGIPIGEQQILNVGLEKEGTFRLDLMGTARTGIDFANIEQAIESLVKEANKGNDNVITGQFNAQGMKNTIYKYLREGASAFSGEGLTETLSGLRESGHLPGKARGLYEAFLMKKYEGFAETVFGRGSINTISDLAGRIAQADVGDSAAMTKIAGLGAADVRRFARAYGRGDKGFFLQGGLERVEDIFGTTEQAVSGIRTALGRAGVTGWDVGKISRALQPGGAGREELTGLMRQDNIVTEVLRQVLRTQEAEKLEDPLGTVGRPMVVEPSAKSVLKKMWK
jgi:hypothetical protein